MGVHPLCRMVLLLMLAIVVQFASAGILSILALTLFLAAYGINARLTAKILRRSRWLLLTLLVIYALTTPGEYLDGWTLPVAPTYEGIASGAIQALRLLAMLAGLACLLGSTSRADLIVGIYLMLQPLRCMGLAVERFTVRLWLTVDYVEREPPPRASVGWQRLNLPDAGDPSPRLDQIDIAIPRFGWRDGLLAILLTLGLIWKWR